MIQIIDTSYPFYRVGRRYFTRLSEARKWGKIDGSTVEKWLPPKQRADMEKCFEKVQGTGKATA